MKYLVLGAGSWGTALAMMLAKQGQQTALWGHNATHIDAMKSAGVNKKYLPDFSLPPSLQLTADLDQAIDEADVILCMTPTSSLNHLFAVIAPKLGDRLLFWGCKGFERGTSKLIHELAAQEGLPAQQIGAISGPSFALEVAQLQPTALVVASQNLSLAEQLANNISEPTLRCYHSDDVAGVEIGGALKNVIAVAAGIADGLGFGANTRAALITRGLAEMSRLAESLGAKASTMMGLAGMGDLLLTATDDQSRNRRFGLALGAGMSVEAAEQSIGQVVEGKYAAYGALQRAVARHVDMPITKMVVAILEGEISPKAAISSLMTRPIKAE